MARPRRLTRAELVAARLATQRLTGAPFASVGAAVAWFGAVQAQDLRGALWGIGQRVRGATEASVEQAFAMRAIVRTWPMRGTLHAVAAADVHELVGLLAPRVLARAAGRYRELAIDERVLGKARDVLAAALAGGVTLTREELYATLAAAGIPPTGQRGIHIIGALAMQRVLCLGALRGRQQTFALLDDWIAPPQQPRERDELLGELARRYFTSHGPATIDDFAWWTGLPLGEARRAHSIARAGLREVSIDGAPYWYAGARRTAARGVHLLPPWDEYTVAYRDRTAIVDGARAANGLAPVILAGGRVAGTWTRRLARDRVIVEPRLFGNARVALGPALARYGAFLGKPAALR